MVEIHIVMEEIRVSIPNLLREICLPNRGARQEAKAKAQLVPIGGGEKEKDAILYKFGLHLSMHSV